MYSLSVEYILCRYSIRSSSHPWRITPTITWNPYTQSFPSNKLSEISQIANGVVLCTSFTSRYCPHLFCTEFLWSDEEHVTVWSDFVHRSSQWINLFSFLPFIKPYQNFTQTSYDIFRSHSTCPNVRRDFMLKVAHSFDTHQLFNTAAE